MQPCSRVAGCNAGRTSHCLTSSRTRCTCIVWQRTTSIKAPPQTLRRCTIAVIKGWQSSTWTIASTVRAVHHVLKHLTINHICAGCGVHREPVQPVRGGAKDQQNRVGGRLREALRLCGTASVDSLWLLDVVLQGDPSPSGPRTSFLSGCLVMLCQSCAGPVSPPCERGTCPDSATLCIASTLLGLCASR